MKTCDYLIIGGGITGLTVAREVDTHFPHARITLIEKEHDVAQHSSGRNSGVLHAGFYYSADSLKARFTREGNQLMKLFCKENNLRINPCGKLIVAKDKDDLKVLEELKKRGDCNGVELIWMSPSEVNKIEPHAKTFERALYSPTTATVDPKEICQTLKKELQERGINIQFNAPFLGHDKTHNYFTVRTPKGLIESKFIINCAGLYADQIAQSFGLSQSYVILPFKGTYLSDSGTDAVVKTNIYPVPNLANPFLGIHFTVTVNEKIIIGPAAIPAFWRENYHGLYRFRVNEFLEILYYQLILFARNSFGYRDIAFSELKKYSKNYFRKQANQIVKNINLKGFTTWAKTGIRAQLLNTQTMELIHDFIIENNDDSIHILNVVSPGFTCAFSLARYVGNLLQNKPATESNLTPDT